MLKNQYVRATQISAIAIIIQQQPSKLTNSTGTLIWIIKCIFGKLLKPCFFICGQNGWIGESICFFFLMELTLQYLTQQVKAYENDILYIGGFQREINCTYRTFSLHALKYSRLPRVYLCAAASSFSCCSQDLMQQCCYHYLKNDRG